MLYSTFISFFALSLYCYFCDLFIICFRLIRNCTCFVSTTQLRSVRFYLYPFTPSRGRATLFVILFKISLQIFIFYEIFFILEELLELWFSEDYLLIIISTRFHSYTNSLLNSLFYFFSIHSYSSHFINHEFKYILQFLLLKAQICSQAVRIPAEPIKWHFKQKRRRSSPFPCSYPLGIDS